MSLGAAVIQERGWYKATRLDWNLLHPDIIRRRSFHGLIRLCREPQRGWLKTIRFDKSTWTRHGTDDFLGPD